MTDRPILFSGPMVRALLAGTKTQTRRDLTKTFARYPHLVGYETDGTLKQLDGKKVPHVEFVHTLLGLWHPEENPRGRSGWYVPLKAAVGDRLWVRESWKATGLTAFNRPSETRICGRFAYMADEEQLARDAMIPWRPSIHMPRWASRLTLTVTDVRVERLQDISEQDAITEGADISADHRSQITGGPMVKVGPGTYMSPIAWYHRLWNDINGDGAWESNPWVVAYTFTVHHSNIDQIAKVAA